MVAGKSRHPARTSTVPDAGEIATTCPREVFERDLPLPASATLLSLGFVWPSRARCARREADRLAPRPAARLIETHWKPRPPVRAPARWWALGATPASCVDPMAQPTYRSPSSRARGSPRPACSTSAAAPPPRRRRSRGRPCSSGRTPAASGRWAGSTGSSGTGCAGTRPSRRARSRSTIRRSYCHAPLSRRRTTARRPSRASRRRRTLFSTSRAAALRGARPRAAGVVRRLECARASVKIGHVWPWKSVSAHAGPMARPAALGFTRSKRSVAVTAHSGQKQRRWLSTV